MNDFTASNGIEIRITTDLGGDKYLHGTVPDEVGPVGFTPELHATASEKGLEALREFFQAEADERLGRWRWPENPDFVVYDNDDEDGGVWVHSEREPGAIQYQSPGDVPHAWVSTEAGYVAAARAYFDAHPEPKPWDEAKPGDVWRFETSDDRRHALGWVAQDGTWDLMTPRGENVREVVEPMAWLVENWGDEFKGAKATRFVPEVSS